MYQYIWDIDYPYSLWRVNKKTKAYQIYSDFFGGMWIPSNTYETYWCAADKVTKREARRLAPWAEIE